MEQNKKHTLQIEHGQGFIAAAVADVLSFNEGQITVRLTSGERLTVYGAGLKINGFNKQSGELKVVGAVQTVKYIPSVKQKFRKLFG